MSGLDESLKLSVDDGASGHRSSSLRRSIDMPNSPSFFRRLISELGRRHVLRVAAVYLVVAWIVIQVAAITFPSLLLPAWALRLVIVLAILALPVVLVIGWAFELTPDGIRRTPTDAGSGGGLGRGSRVVLGAAVLALVGVLALGAREMWLRPSRAAAADTTAARSMTTGGRTSGAARLDPTRVAVLYLDDNSESHDLGYLADGLTESLIHELSHVQGLSVVSLNGVKPFRSHPASIDSIGRALGAGSVVEGSVQRSGDQVRVIVQLVDVASGSTLPSLQVQRPAEDLFALLDDVTADVASSLRRQLGREVRLQEAHEGAHDPEAWKLYQIAMRVKEGGDSLRLTDDTAAARRAYRTTDSLLAVAEHLDPEWSVPTIQRGWTALQQARLAPVITDVDTKELRRGLADADRVLATHSDEPHALTLKGIVEYFLSKPRTFSSEETRAWREAAERDLRAATLQDTLRDPAMAAAWARLAYMLDEQGEFDEARLAAQRAFESDAFLSNDRDYLYITASLALELKRLDQADRLLEKGQSLFPSDPAYPGLRLVVVASQPPGPGRVQLAWSLLHGLEARTGGSHYQTGRFMVAATLARAGLRDSARAVRDRARALDPDAPQEPYYEAYVALQLGDRDRALALLRRCVENGWKAPGYIAHDWWWTPLRDDRRFQTLIGTGKQASR